MRPFSMWKPTKKNLDTNVGYYNASKIRSVLRVFLLSNLRVDLQFFWCETHPSWWASICGPTICSLPLNYYLCSLRGVYIDSCVICDRYHIYSAGTRSSCSVGLRMGVHFPLLHGDQSLPCTFWESISGAVAKNTKGLTSFSRVQ